MKFKIYDLQWFVCYGMTIFIVILTLFNLEEESKIICLVIAFGVMSFVALITMFARTSWMNRYDEVKKKIKVKVR